VIYYDNGANQTSSGKHGLRSSVTQKSTEKSTEKSDLAVSALSVGICLGVFFIVFALTDNMAAALLTAAFLAGIMRLLLLVSDTCKGNSPTPTTTKEEL
jgi:hypothetical protein